MLWHCDVFGVPDVRERFLPTSRRRGGPDPRFHLYGKSTMRQYRHMQRPRRMLKGAEYYCVRVSLLQWKYFVGAGDV